MSRLTSSRATAALATFNPPDAKAGMRAEVLAMAGTPGQPYGSILKEGWYLRRYRLIVPRARRLPARTAGQDSAWRISAAKISETKRKPERKMTDSRMTPNP